MLKKSFQVSFQGVPGAYSEAAALALFPKATTLPCATFAAAFAAVSDGTVDCAVIPVENIIAGRVADVHILLPDSGLSITAEYFAPIAHRLLVLPGTKLPQIKTVLSHTQGLAQCRLWIEQQGLVQETFHDTAGSAAEVAARGDPSHAAIASARAGDLYGLEALELRIMDQPNNTTRFLVLSRMPEMPPSTEACMTTLAFTLRSVPAALYKALGGFATNAVNLTRIESYVSPNDFKSASFTIDIEGHPELPAMALALDELKYFTSNLTLLGTYPQASWRVQDRYLAVD